MLRFWIASLLGPASNAAYTWTQVGDKGMSCTGAEFLGDLTLGEGAESAGACLALVQADSRKPDYALWRGEPGGSRGCYACDLSGRGLGPDPSTWAFDEAIQGEVSMCGYDPSAPTPAPGGNTWTGSLDTYAWALNTKCADGKEQNPVTTTNSIVSMADPLSSCVEQTGSSSGQKYYAKWTCSQNSPGGELTSVKCGQDAQCGTCTGDEAKYTINILPYGGGACLDMNSSPSGGGDLKAYLMVPPTADDDPLPGDPVYERAIPPCMIDSTPPPTPAPPTPPPATTCDACVMQDNKQWCWPADGGFSRAMGAADAGHCATPGGLDCSKDRSTCHMQVDCACSDCADSEACGGPGPTPAPATTCAACVAQDNKQWCYGVDGAPDGCYTPGGMECTRARSTCKMTIDCACSDCANSDSCKNAPTPAPYPTECPACVATNYEWCWSTNTCGPKQSCNFFRAVCDTSDDCQCQQCSNPECQGSGPTPSPVPTPPTPAVPTPAPTACELCLAEDKEWCWKTKTCIAPASGCGHSDCVFGGAGDICQCTSCADPSCNAVPTPSPALTCADCIELDNMEWCWDPKPGSFAAAVGAAADVGYCLKPGDGCTESRATCKMPIDCHCSDCADSAACGGPNPQEWTGDAKTYEYPHATGCNLADRPAEPAWTVYKVSRMPTDPMSKCSWTRKTGSQMGYLYIKETCQHPGSQTGSMAIVRTVCHNNDCTSCEASGIAYAVEYLDDSGGACMVATGYSHVSTLSYMMDLKSVTTDSGTLSLANPTCLVPPHTLPTPAPTPAEWATCKGCIANGDVDNKQWCWGETDPATGVKGKAHCATPGGWDCSVPRSTCPMGVDCACSDCDDSERCGGPPKKKSSKVGIGVGLGLGIPAMAAGLFFFQKKRVQARAMSMGTANQALTGTGATTLEPADYAQL